MLEHPAITRARDTGETWEQVDGFGDGGDYEDDTEIAQVEHIGKFCKLIAGV